MKVKCELCKREARGRQTLCESCADAIRRLVNINQQPVEEKPRVLARGNAG